MFRKEQPNLQLHLVEPSSTVAEPDNTRPESPIRRMPLSPVIERDITPPESQISRMSLPLMPRNVHISKSY